MKRNCFFSLLFLWSCCIANAQDLANPSPNLQALPGGSYIIAMDNTWQTNDNSNPSKRYFNLKSYGLVVHLLNNKIKIKRIITSGKVKDAIDFSVPCVMIKPTLETVAITRDFKAGPFVIMGPDALNVDIDRLIDNYNNNAANISGITNSNDKVKVYKTTTAIFNVDVRHDLTNFIPKACILNDGGNAGIHENYMEIAGIPSTNYLTSFNTNLTINCFTFASEPHNGNPSISVVNNIKNFILAGGNFLAQCDAINSYENLGKFQTTNGFTVANSSATVSFPNADLPFSQIQGIFSIKQGGSVQNWRIPVTSAWANGASYVATGSSNTLFGASVSKIIPAGSVGGLVFYLGNHSFSSTSDYNEINGMRMYMNAFLTPANTTSQLNYQYTMSCSNNRLTVSATSGPPVSYPITFQLYADVGSQQGAIDGSDPYVGIATINSSGGVNTINVNSSYSTQPLLLLIQPSISCYPAITVSPNNCFFAVLPISIKSFIAKRLNPSKVLLKWQAMNTTQVAGYNVKRKIGGLWTTIKFINAAGALNSTGQEFEFEDANSAEGTSQYQIEEVTTDGKTRVSEIRSVENKSYQISVYPNPAEDGKFVIDFMDALPKQINVYSLLGKKIKSISTVDKHVLVENLTKGEYAVSISNAQGELIYYKTIMVR